MLTIEPYVPETVRKVPARITKTFQPTMRVHLHVLLSLPLPQLSYSHIQPIGWIDKSVPNNAPTRETRPPKPGILLAMM